MIYRLIHRSLLPVTTSNLKSRITPTSITLKPAVLSQNSTSLTICRDFDDQMAKKVNNKGKGIKRKGPKRASSDGNQLSQTGQERAMSHRNNNFRSEQARERLESAVWNNQPSSSHHHQPQTYQNQTWPQQQQQQQHTSYPEGAGRGGYQPAPGMTRLLNPETADFAPPPPQETSRWTPPHHEPPPQPPSGFQHWMQTVSAPGNSYPAQTATAASSNSPFFFDLGGSRNTNFQNTPHTSVSDTKRSYSTVPNNNHNNTTSYHGREEAKQQQEEDFSTPAGYEPWGSKPRRDNNNQNNNSKKNKKQQQKYTKNDQSHLRINESRDDISAPSAESGGIPEPDPAYLLRASFMPRPSPTPRPILVVIDLNGTMLFRPSRRNPHSFVTRPYATQFLDYCIRTFHVVFWSSARPENVKQMLDKLLTKQQLDNVVAIWGREKFGLTTEDYNKRTQCYKRLTRLWEDPEIAAAHPEGEPWNQGNTVLIDDSMEKARSEPYNAITLPEYLGGKKEEPAVLPLVHDYLNTLAMQTDISTYIRLHPFDLDGQADAAVVMSEEAVSLAADAAGTIRDNV